MMKNRSDHVGKLANINIELGVVSVLSIIGVIFITLFICFPSYREELKFTAMIFGGIAAIYSAYYVGARLREEVRRASVEKAIDLSKSFDDIKMAEIRAFIEKEYLKTTPDEFDNKIRENFELSRNVVKLLSAIEDISVAIQQGLADEKTLHMAISFLVERSYSCFSHFIEAERIKYDDNRIYNETEMLAIAWKNGKWLYKS